MIQLTKQHSRPIVAYFFAALVMLYLSHELPRLLPGDFVTAMYANSHVTLNAEQEAGLRSYYTQNESFGRFLVNFFSLNWGYSYAYLTPISKLILEALPWTLLLLGGAHLISTLLGFVAGVEAAWRRGAAADKGGIGVMTVLEGFPEIVTGVLLLLIFALQLGWFPAAGAQTAYADHSMTGWLIDVARHVTLPLATLIIAYFPGNFLLARGSMVLVLKAQHVQTARAKGLPARRIRYRHAARNALLPMVTRFGLRIAFMITGAMVVETIHSYPGLGTLLFNAIGMRDLPLIQGIVLFSSLMVLLVNVGMEYFYRRLDPRVRQAMHHSAWRHALKDSWFRLGLVLAICLTGLAVFGPLTTSFDPHDMSFPPLGPPSAEHWLGVNDGGMDILSELLFGLRNTFAFGLLAGTVGLFLGVTIGLASAWFGGWIDRILMRIGDVLLAIPSIMVLILIAALFRPSVTLLAFILAFMSWPTTAKGIRAQALTLRQSKHVLSAKRMGASGYYIIGRHLLPELFPLYLIGFAAKTRAAILMEASLAFLGLFDPSRKSLGMMISYALKYYYLDIWWNWLLPPILGLTLLIMTVTFLAVGLETAFDPRLKEAW